MLRISPRELARHDPLVPNVVERAVAGGANQVGSKTLFDLQRPSPTPQLEHYLLRDLLGWRSLTYNRFSHSHKTRIVRAKDRVECAFVPRPDSLLKIQLVRIVPIQGG